MSEPKFRAHNGIRTSWIPIDIDSGPQPMHIGDAKVLLITEGPDKSKTLNIYYEVDTESYEDFRSMAQVFYVIGIGEQVPEGATHAGSLALRSGNVFHVYIKNEEHKGGVQLQAEG
ncbi:hypothetical protein HWC66_gp77 [Gordonia phage Chikenjars]|uniref:DUF7352 domain-containing protein n=1 Tax=Gordonia phage Chikenjars TaxID=2601686 RepID=A0A5J6D972_9CAUD|nr:hypothetical protein HWC66_gp77 [Gordonia phage Chikenjars]QEQ94380.1 hypothetical protein SEA_CHIKENJARS_77 [Gordonia phage Chikenjars]